MRAVGLALAFAILLTAPAASACWAVAPPVMQDEPWPTPYAAGLENATVTTRVTAGYVVTEVSATLRNLLPVPLAAQMRVPVPEGAFPTNLTLIVNGTPYYATVEPAADAKARFEAAKREGRNAGLVASASENLFTYDLTVGALETVEATLRYETFLPRERGAYSLLVPLPASDGPVEAAPLTLDVTIEDPRGVAAVNVSGLRVPSTLTPTAGGHRLQAGPFIPERGDVVRLVYATGPTPAGGILLVHEDATTRYFLHALAPVPATTGGILAKDVTFVLDVSGSMSGQKLQQMKDATMDILRELREGDTFNLVTFSTGVAAWSPEPVPATPTRIEEAVEFVRSLTADGGTNIHGALLDGLLTVKGSDGRVPLLVFLTDGLPSAGRVTDPARIRDDVRRANEGRVSVHTLGFGGDVDMRFLEALALENGGAGRAIRADAEAATEIGNYFETVATPLLRDAVLTYGPNAQDVTPANVPHLFAGSETVIVGRLPKTAAALEYAVHATAADGPFEARGSLDLSEASAQPFVGRLFAYRQLAATLDRMKVEGETETLVALATAQALEGGFVTPYTSFIVEAREPPAPAEVPQPDSMVAGSLVGGSFLYDAAYAGAPVPPAVPSPALALAPKSDSSNAVPDTADPRSERVAEADGSAAVPTPNLLVWLLVLAVVAVSLRRRAP